MTNNGNSG